MSKPSRRSSFGKDAVTARVVLGIGSATNSVARLGKFSGQRYSFAAPFDGGNTPLNRNTREFALKFFDLFGITVAASAGLCAAALAFSPGAAAAPLPTGGPGCVQKMAGLEALTGVPACVDQMAGLAAPVAGAAPLVPAVLPGPPVVPAGAPLPAGLPAGAPVPAGLPAGAPVPVGAPVAAGVPGGAPAAPLLQQSGTGKGVPTNGAPTAGPVVLPGPPAPIAAPAG
jgi:hypothetical protein